jgi:hypothetical protein
MKIKKREKKFLLVHPENVNLAAVKPVLELFMARLCVVLALQVKSQKDIVNLIEQRLVTFVALASLCLQVSWYGSPPVIKFPNHTIKVKTELNKRFGFFQTPLYSNATDFATH